MKKSKRKTKKNPHERTDIWGCVWNVSYSHSSGLCACSLESFEPDSQPFVRQQCDPTFYSPKGQILFALSVATEKPLEKKLCMLVGNTDLCHTCRKGKKCYIIWSTIAEMCWFQQIFWNGDVGCLLKHVSIRCDGAVSVCFTLPKTFSSTPSLTITWPPPDFGHRFRSLAPHTHTPLCNCLALICVWCLTYRQIWLWIYTQRSSGECRRPVTGKLERLQRHPQWRTYLGRPMSQSDLYSVYIVTLSLYTYRYSNPNPIYI